MFIVWIVLCFITQALPDGAAPLDLDQNIIKGNYNNKTNTQEYELSFMTKTPKPEIFLRMLNETEETDSSEEETEENDWNRAETKSTGKTGLTTKPTKPPSQSNTPKTTTASKVQTGKPNYDWASKAKDGDTSPGYHLGRSSQAITSDPMHMFLTISLPIAICLWGYVGTFLHIWA